MLTTEGLEEFRQSVQDAANELRDPSAVNADAALQVLDLVDPPILSGNLADTIRAEHDATGFRLVAGGPTAPYGPIVHARDPFLTDALNEADVEAFYADYLDQLVDQIQGA